MGMHLGTQLHLFLNSNVGLWTVRFINACRAPEEIAIARIHAPGEERRESAVFEQLRNQAKHGEGLKLAREHGYL